MAGGDESRLVRRLRRFLLMAVAVAVLAGAGLVASLWVKSPGQRAAEQSPPSASVVTAALQEKMLEKAVVVRGKVVASSRVAVTGASTSTAAQSRRVVTAVAVAVGGAVTSGTVLGTVSGRPLIVLSGSAPAYRDFVPGISGDDVSQLQAALVEVGVLRSAGTSGTYDRATEAAVTQLYASKSMKPLTTADLDPTQTSRIEDLETSVRAAQRAVEDARTALGAAPAGADRSVAVRTLTRAQEDLSAAQKALSAVRAAAGVILPLSEVVFAPMPALVQSVVAAVGTDLSSASDPTIMTLAAGTMTVQGVVPTGSQDGIATGLAATVTDDATATSKAATVTSLGAYQAAGDAATGVQTAGYPVTVTIPEAMMASWIGRNVRVRIVVGATSAKVLVAPLTAVRSNDDGTSFVVVVDGSTQRQIAVRTGLVAAGEVEVTPVESGALSAGTKVRVG